MAKRESKRWVQRALHKSRRGALHRRLKIKGVISTKRLRKEERTSLRLLRRAVKKGARRKVTAALRRLGQVRFALRARGFKHRGSALGAHARGARCLGV